MDPGFLVEGVLRSVMGGRAKRSRKALRYLTGRQGSFLSHPATLLTAAGVAWGIYETMKGQSVSDSRGSTGSSGSTGPAQATYASSPAAVAGDAGAADVPPLPNLQGTPPVDDDAMRLVRLAVSAAHADGEMNERERAAILQQATDAGVADLVEQELHQPTPLAQIVSGVSDPAQRATLYVLAFTIARADEQVSGAERIYLAQLAHQLCLDPATVQQLERDTGERIEALGDQGQLGG
jgi:uncharacterized membrane protein YebE (DUF533 family)